MRAGNCFKPAGLLLKIGTQSSFDPLIVTCDGDMGQEHLYTEWVEMNEESHSGSFEFLWSGTEPLGEFVIEGSLVGPPNDLDVLFQDEAGNTGNPDGTTYTGDLHAVNVVTENLGHTLLELTNIVMGKLRAVYTRTSGSGMLNVRYRALCD